MSGRERISDLELNALLDGELSAEQEARLRRLLDRDPDARARLDADAAVTARLHAALNPVLSAPVPARLLLAPGARRRNRLWVGATLAAGLALGLVAGWWLADPARRSEPAVVESALSAHAVFLPEVRHPVEVGAAQRAHLDSWLSKRLDHALKAPNLEDVGFSLVGGRLLPDVGKPAAQFMYQSGSGDRLTIYCRLEAPDAEWPLRYASGDGAGLFHWAEGGMSYAVVANLDRAALRRLAAAAHPQL